jgi:hypothetical protein
VLLVHLKPGTLLVQGAELVPFGLLPPAALEPLVALAQDISQAGGCSAVQGLALLIRGLQAELHRRGLHSNAPSHAIANGRD